MDYYSYEGFTTTPFKVAVTREMIADYARSIEETESLFFNYKEAINKGYADIPAPPCMPMIFWQYIKVPWMNGGDSFIHKYQSINYSEPVMAGQTYTCMITLKSVKSKRSFLILDNELVGENERGKVIFTSNSTLIGEMKK
ncbi:FAS1-like dehydratase domain-containing protein [Paenisporosarcina sp. TG-14]|uniref:FAS1-like dehydratase domain-containing protein n=1 Tax=Paenisporosarcina sp. TG-14 TaxID=1231057 RepID=UPI0002FA6199|nr:MaoC family dehydratase N-terminal domain-containing protein [Paenisporosarcina sp. TG-14]